MALFRIPGGAYRRFDKYVDATTDSIRACPRDCDIRLYVDDSIGDTWRKWSGIEVVRFSCPPFRSGRGHDGTFGSIVRFLPLFQWPGGYEAVWVADVDLPAVRWKEGREHLERMIQLGYSLGYFTILCYNKLWASGEYPVVNLRVLGRRAMGDASTIDRFLTRVLGGEYSELAERLIERNERAGRGHAARLFPYGFDELFSNQVLAERRALVCQFVSLRHLFRKAVGAGAASDPAFSELDEIETAMWLGRTLSSSSRSRHDELVLDLHSRYAVDEGCWRKYVAALRWRLPGRLERMVRL